MDADRQRALEVLELASDATDADIRAAYKRLAHAWASGGNPGAPDEAADDGDEEGDEYEDDEYEDDEGDDDRNLGAVVSHDPFAGGIDYAAVVDSFTNMRTARGPQAGPGLTCYCSECVAAARAKRQLLAERQQRREADKARAAARAQAEEAERQLQEEDPKRSLAWTLGGQKREALVRSHFLRQVPTLEVKDVEDTQVLLQLVVPDTSLMYASPLLPLGVEWEVRWQVAGEGRWRQQAAPKEREGSAHTQLLTRLTPGTEYTLQVRSGLAGSLSWSGQPDWGQWADGGRVTTTGTAPDGGATTARGGKKKKNRDAQFALSSSARWGDIMDELEEEEAVGEGEETVEEDEEAGDEEGAGAADEREEGVAMAAGAVEVDGPGGDAGGGPGGLPLADAAGQAAAAAAGAGTGGSDRGAQQSAGTSEPRGGGSSSARQQPVAASGEGGAGADANHTKQAEPHSAAGDGGEAAPAASTAAPRRAQRPQPPPPPPRPLYAPPGELLSPPVFTQYLHGQFCPPRRPSRAEVQEALMAAVEAGVRERLSPAAPAPAAPQPPPPPAGGGQQRPGPPSAAAAAQPPPPPAGMQRPSAAPGPPAAAPAHKQPPPPPPAMLRTASSGSSAAFHLPHLALQSPTRPPPPMLLAASPGAYPGGHALVAPPGMVVAGRHPGMPGMTLVAAAPQYLTAVPVAQLQHARPLVQVLPAHAAAMSGHMLVQQQLQHVQLQRQGSGPPPTYIATAHPPWSPAAAPQLLHAHPHQLHHVQPQQHQPPPPPPQQHHQAPHQVQHPPPQQQQHQMQHQAPHQVQHPPQPQQQQHQMQHPPPPPQMQHQASQPQPQPQHQPPPPQHQHQQRQQLSSGPRGVAAPAGPAGSVRRASGEMLPRSGGGAGSSGGGGAHNVAPALGQGGRRQTLCHFWRRGVCKNGDKCAFIHAGPGGSSGGQGGGSGDGQ